MSNPVPVLTRRRQKEIAALMHKKHRSRQGTFLVEGLRAVQSAAEAQAPLTEVIVSTPRLAALQRTPWFKALKVPVYQAPAPTLASLTDVQTHQGIVAVARMQPRPVAALTDLHTILALDGVQDPGNVGTLIRTAAWFGVSGVLLGPGTADVYSPKVVRASMGGLWDLMLAPVDALDDALETLRAAGFVCYGADLDGTDARQWTPAVPSVLVLGSEAHGLSAAVRAVVGARVGIDGAGARCGVESLNVAVAGGILMQRWTDGLPEPARRSTAG